MSDLEEFATAVGEITKQYLIDSFVEQGHNLTGKMRDSIRYSILELTDLSATIRFYMLSYGIIQNEGIPPERIPFGDRDTGAKTSAYIQGLVEFAKERFRLGSDAALAAAFAIARIHKYDIGMPSRGSMKYSRTGERTDFIPIALRRVIPKIRKIATGFVGKLFTFIIREYETGRVNTNLAA
jgi:hypothetical protein